MNLLIFVAENSPVTNELLIMVHKKKDIFPKHEIINCFSLNITLCLYLNLCFSCSEKFGEFPTEEWRAASLFTSPSAGTRPLQAVQSWGWASRELCLVCRVRSRTRVRSGDTQLTLESSVDSSEPCIWRQTVTL